jgi:transcriptional regulator GlxA family with amidase domain
MKKVYFLLPHGSIKPSLLFLAIDMFEMANEYLLKQHGKPFYDIKIVGEHLSQHLWDSQLLVQAQEVSQLPCPDLVIIPGGSVRNDYSQQKNKALAQWMIEQYKEGAELASLCTGAFLLAATGLLNNMECTTHWQMTHMLAERHPAIKLCSDKIITESKGIYTASGAVSSMNLILHLIEKYSGRQAAIYAAKMMHIDMDRTSQSVFAIFEGQKDHDDEAIKKVQSFIEKNIDDKITVDYLAEKFSIPKRSFLRRFKNATHNSPIEYIQRTKIEAAKRKLETNRKSVNEIMYEVGYADIKAFRNIFKKISGLSPIEYRKKYNKDVIG